MDGEYEVFEKLASRSEPETASIRASANLLEVEFANLQPGHSVKGQIVMNGQTTPAVQAWGFWDVQLKAPDTVLVYTTFAAPQSPVVRATCGSERRDVSGATEVAIAGLQLPC